MEQLVITRSFNAPIETVWDAFVNPRKLKDWWSPIGMNSFHISVDLKTNGLFIYCFEDGEGHQFWGRGEYKEISKPNKLSYLDSFSDPEGYPVPPSYFGMVGDDILNTLVEFTFTQSGDMTIMKMVGENPYDESMSEDMTNGWNSMFDKLDSIL